MRVKFQMKNAAGIYSDVLLDPEMGHVIGLEFIPADLHYISRRRLINKGAQRLLIGAMPRRIRTAMSPGGRGKPVELVIDRNNADWLAIELTPSDVLKLTHNPGSGDVLRVCAIRPSTGFTKKDRMAFMSDGNWPATSTKVDGQPDEMLGGAPRFLLGRETEAEAFRAWVKDWPPIFHSTEKAPEAKLILPNGAAND